MIRVTLAQRIPVRNSRIFNSKLPRTQIIHLGNEQKYVSRSLTRNSHSEVSRREPTKIEKIILDNIKATGPISYATYMQLCLSHPTAGYYMNPSNQVFGPRGDFITSPEISQVFGELVGIWLLSQWKNAINKPKIRLIELGPGRGTLMQDITRVVTQFTGTSRALQSVHLVETSAWLRQIQNDNLSDAAESQGWDLSWHDSINDIPPSDNEYTMLVAHEFFDALPFHYLERTNQGWNEILISSSFDPTRPVSVNPTQDPLHVQSLPPSSHSVRLRPVLSSSSSPTSTLLGMSSPRFKTVPVGSRIEVSPASFRIARKVGEILCSSKVGGCALVVDYGGDHAYGNSFRAFKDHKLVDVFDQPGKCDLTANVDFAYIKEAIGNTSTTLGPISQSEFLHRMGIQLRVEGLKRVAKDEERKRAIENSTQRLIDAAGMGKQYQVLGITARPGGNVYTDIWPFTSDKNT